MADDRDKSETPTGDSAEEFIRQQSRKESMRSLFKEEQHLVEVLEATPLEAIRRKLPRISVSDDKDLLQSVSDDLGLVAFLIFEQGTTPAEFSSKGLDFSRSGVKTRYCLHITNIERSRIGSGFTRHPDVLYLFDAEGDSCKYLGIPITREEKKRLGTFRDIRREEARMNKGDIEMVRRAIKFLEGRLVSYASGQA